MNSITKILVTVPLLLWCSAAAFAQNQPNVSSPTGMQQTDLEKTYQDIKNSFGFVPEFIKKFPTSGLPGAWQEFRDISLNPNTALSAKQKDVISLAISAQVPCSYCLYWDSASAKLNNVSDQAIQEAIGMASLTRHWSTFLNGMNTNEQQFQKQTDEIISLLRTRMQRTPASTKPQTTTPASREIRTPEDAYADIRQTLGSVPSFLRDFPREGITGAWKEMKGLQLNPATTLTGKEKELIGLAVSAQIPCKYCVYFHTKAAKLNGATDREVRESLANAAISRHWSTYFNGAGIDMPAFKSEVDRMMEFVRLQRSRAPASSETDTMLDSEMNSQ